MRTISRDVYKLLMAQGLSAKTAATVEARGIGDGANAGKSARHHQPAGRREEPQPMGIRLAWVNPTALKKRASYTAPLLKVVK